jgi:hypothetical protein
VNDLLTSSIDLWDWRRRVAELYGAVRSSEPQAGWWTWRNERDRLFADHPQSPLPVAERSGFTGVPYFDYSPPMRVLAEVATAPEPTSFGLPHSGDGTTDAIAFGIAVFEIGGRQAALPIYRLLEYGDGFFLPFRDQTNGAETYGGGRYLIDTAKGADLGFESSRLVLDFNFAFHPSCVHSPMWSCPLAPLGNTLPVEIRAGERLVGT